jgi:Family of unknown function (DUF6353)
MKLNELGNVIRTNVKANSPVLLSVMAGLGTVATAYLTARASFQAAETIAIDEVEHGYSHNRKQRLKDRTKLVWKFYIPPAISTISTIVCITGSNRFGARKTLAAQTAFAFTERAYAEYRDRVIEEFGERKDQTIRDKMAEDRVAKTPPPEILVSGPGNVLCCEMWTGRYFISDMESLRKAQNELNARLLKHDYATLDDFYYILNIPITTSSGEAGWKSDKLMELEFSAVLTPDGRPCLTFNYNYVTPL